MIFFLDFCYNTCELGLIDLILGIIVSEGAGDPAKEPPNNPLAIPTTRSSGIVVLIIVEI